MKIFAAREEDAHQGWVWLQNPNFSTRSIIKITNPKNGQCVYCEALQIESNFLKKYNQPPRIPIDEPTSALVIGEWFRDGLGGLETQFEFPLQIVQCNSSWARFRACTHHPQIIVRVAAWLGGIGLVLGLIGFILGVVSVLPTKPGA